MDKSYKITECYTANCTVTKFRHAYLMPLKFVGMSIHSVYSIEKSKTSKLSIKVHSCCKKYQCLFASYWKLKIQLSLNKK